MLVPMFARAALTLTLLPVLTVSSVSVVAANSSGLASATIMRSGGFSADSVTGDLRLRLLGTAADPPTVQSETSSTLSESGPRAVAEALQEGCRGDGCANLPDDGRLQGNPVYTLVLSPSQGEDDSRPQLVIMFN